MFVCLLRYYIKYDRQIVNKKVSIVVRLLDMMLSFIVIIFFKKKLMIIVKFVLKIIFINRYYKILYR